MKERPILFSGAMVNAILAGKKTRARFLVQPKHEKYLENLVGNFMRGNWEKRPQPYGIAGDRLWPSLPIPSLGRNYCADTHGHIWSRARDGETWRRLRPSQNSKGYLTVSPAVDGQYKTKLVHRLISEAFYGEIPFPLSQVCHLDGDRTNCAPINLDYGTQQDNWADRLFHGKGCGELHHAAKLTQQQAEEIRASGSSQRFLAARYGVTQTIIWGIKNDYLWVKNPKPRTPNMPRWVSRVTLEVIGVRIERLQDITEADAQAEGVEPIYAPHGGSTIQPYWHGFRVLWDSINGERASWESNPLVWVIEFTKL